ncbi:uncharacterized protein EV420DRAFT_1029925 [Desarmillaria tabescens]|uniref:Uncharacterized protein n=1 Tax=Armillaria tabescens TaxID=1929756 RepID=A0AA39JIH9_ARMTA|nr:uncharacterized protein EV420DRAFT_1029925 [Desarmillaria tabescens]KAK0443392.1 hypothetical protein EV420DRAFT_1029925 [Desarmillaria tabescens]
MTAYLEPYSTQAPPQSQPTLKNGRRATTTSKWLTWLDGGQSLNELAWRWWMQMEASSCMRKGRRVASHRTNGIRLRPARNGCRAWSNGRLGLLYRRICCNRVRSPTHCHPPASILDLCLACVCIKQKGLKVAPFRSYIAIACCRPLVGRWGSLSEMYNQWGAKIKHTFLASESVSLLCNKAIRPSHVRMSSIRVNASLSLAATNNASRKSLNPRTVQFCSCVTVPSRRALACEFWKKVAWQLRVMMVRVEETWEPASVTIDEQSSPPCSPLQPALTATSDLPYLLHRL